jgi:hypothetical protein
MQIEAANQFWEKERSLTIDEARRLRILGISHLIATLGSANGTTDPYGVALGPLTHA